MNPKVDFYFEKATAWSRELGQLRTIVLDTGLTEELKWGVPCYTLQGKNVVVIHAFKEYCALLFFKGALLKDTKSILVQQTANVQAARQLRFTSLTDIIKRKAVIKAYIYEAIEVEKAGLIVPMKKSTEFAIPEEFQKRLDKSATLKKAFSSLTPGRQRGYLLHFAQPKQAKTREARVEKNIPRILQWKGLDDE